MEDVRVEHEPGRFVARVEGLEATVVYERSGDVLEVLHTWTPPPLRGRDLAANLTRAVFAHAAAAGLRVRPTCSYTRAWVAQHPDVAGLVVRE
jgi:hypothetical protein